MLLTWRIRLWRWAPVGWGVAALAVVLTVAHVLAPAPPVTLPVVVASGDLAAGTTLTTADLRLSRVPRSAIPETATADAAALVGRTLAVPVPGGLPLVPALLAGDRFTLEPPAGTSVVALDLVGAGALRVGDEVDVVPAGCDGAEPARALVVEAADDAAPAMLALDPADAVRIVTAREICALAAVVVQ